MYLVPQILAALAVSLGPFAAGLGKGYSSPAVDSLKEQQNRFPAAVSNTSSGVFTVSEQQASWVASLSLLGAFFGGMLGGLAMRFGRKRVLLITSLPFSASWLMTVFASSVEMMFATAFVGGFCCAIVLVVTQVTHHKAYHFNNILTVWITVLVNVTVPHLLNTSPAFYKTRRFITVYTTARKATLIHSMPPSCFNKIRFNIILSSANRSEESSLILKFSPPKPCMHFYSHPYVSHASQISPSVI